jgi:hypothetical protein
VEISLAGLRALVGDVNNARWHYVRKVIVGEPIIIRSSSSNTKFWCLEGAGVLPGMFWWGGPLLAPGPLGRYAFSSAGGDN